MHKLVLPRGYPRQMPGVYLQDISRVPSEYLVRISSRHPGMSRWIACKTTRYRGILGAVRRRKRKRNIQPNFCLSSTTCTERSTISPPRSKEIWIHSSSAKTCNICISGNFFNLFFVRQSLSEPLTRGETWHPSCYRLRRDMMAVHSSSPVTTDL